jgi:hypothetical protein
MGILAKFFDLLWGWADYRPKGLVGAALFCRGGIRPRKPDIVCLQETKCVDAADPPHERARRSDRANRIGGARR